MKFVISASALNFDEHSHDLIDRLIDRAADLAHRIEFADADLIEDSKWYGTARGSRRRLALAAAAIPPRRASTGALHAKTHLLNSKNDIEVAAKSAYSPLIILVEDCEADGILIDLVARKLGSTELSDFWCQTASVTPRAYVFQTSGGLGAMPIRVQRAVTNAHQEGRPPRIIVICDSDRRWPGDNASPSQRSLDDLAVMCAQHNANLHILRKRSAENYIPDEVFKAWRDAPNGLNNKHRFEAFLRRTEAQRDHFPIKDGISTAEITQCTGAHLYTVAEAADLLLLQERLFPKRPRVLNRLLESNEVDFTAQGLKRRDGDSELSVLLDLIAGEL